MPKTETPFIVNPVCFETVQELPKCHPRMLYDILGREIRMLESGQKEIGAYQISWDSAEIKMVRTHRVVFTFIDYKLTLLS